jgi:hypothetical protein
VKIRKCKNDLAASLGTERYPKADGVEVFGLRELAQELWSQGVPFTIGLRR